MDVKEKLVELLTSSPQLDVLDWTTGWEEAANYLISHGVTVQECKLGDKETNADRIRSMSDEELAEWLVEKTAYQESVFTYPTYLNFLTESDDTKEGAIKGTVEWLHNPSGTE